MLSVYRARISCTESDAFYWRLECYPDLLLVMARRNRVGSGKFGVWIPESLAMLFDGAMAV